jgi:hypothetical protein
MQLMAKQISKIDEKINLFNGRMVVKIDVMGDKNLSVNEQVSNIYCVDDQYNIIWQVREIKTNPPFPDDGFIYLNQNKNGEIIADRFSGFEYKINPETGEAEQIGFHK